MSQTTFLLSAQFGIAQRNEEAARLSLVALALEVLEKQDMRAGDIQALVQESARSVDKLTLDELVQCWGWSLNRKEDDEAGQVIGIWLEEECSVDEESLFEALAPNVVAGSYVTLEGRDTGGDWLLRYAFTGKRLVVQKPTFPPLPIEGTVQSYVRFLVVFLSSLFKGKVPRSLH